MSSSSPSPAFSSSPSVSTAAPFGAPSSSPLLPSRQKPGWVARLMGPALFCVLGALSVGGAGCGSGTSTGTSSGAGSAGCTDDSECSAFSSTCCDCVDSAAHNSEVRGLQPQCGQGGKQCANPAACTASTSRRAQCEGGRCLLRTAANMALDGYDTSCKVASDCVTVSTKFECSTCGRDPDAAINKSSLAAYQAAFTERFSGFHCPAPTGDVMCPDVEPRGATCVNNVCKVQ